MFVVAIAELAHPLEDEAPSLATPLGLTAFDVRTRAAGVLPKIVAQYASRDDAERALSVIRARGHGALVCDTRDVIAGRDMVHLRRFALEEHALREGAEILPWDAIAALIVVAARTDVVRTTRERDVEVTGRSARIVERDHARHEHVMEQSAYLVPRHGSPWVLHERGAKYVALGNAMRPTQHENFAAMVSLVRGRALGAIFDDRFAMQPQMGSQLVMVRGHDSAEASSTDAGIDMAVHLLAQWLLRGHGGPYRG